MATATIYSDATAVDGYVGRAGVNEAFATIISANGTASQSTFNTMVIGIRAASGSPNWQYCYRSIVLMNLYAALPAGAIIDSAVLNLHVVDLLADAFGAKLVLTNAPVGSYTALDQSDYQNLYGTPTEHGVERHALSTLPDGTNFTFTLNAQALLTAQATLASATVFELGLQLDYDFDRGSPVWSASAASRVDLSTVESSTAAWRPALVVTYHVGATPPPGEPGAGGSTGTGGQPPTTPPPPSVPPAPGITIGATPTTSTTGGGSTTTDLGPAPMIPPPLAPTPLVPVPFPVDTPQEEPQGEPSEAAPTVRVVLQASKGGTPYQTQITPFGTARRSYRRYRAGGAPPTSGT